MHENLAWDDLLYVLTVGRTGQLAEAARILHVNHSTVFRRIGKIEEQLGVRLFDRQRDGYVATAPGEAMIELASRIEEDVVALERRLAGEDLRPEGSLRVTTNDTMTPLLMPLLTRFQAQYPEIDIDLSLSNTTYNLSRRDADVAIRPTIKPDEALIGRRLATMPYALYASPAYLQSMGGFDLAMAHRWIGFSTDLSHLRAYGWLDRHVGEGRIAFRSCSLNAMAAAAEAGAGVTILPCYIGDSSSGLIRCGDILEEVYSNLWLLVHEDLRNTARVRTFSDFIAGELARYRPLFEGRSTEFAQAA